MFIGGNAGKYVPHYATENGYLENAESHGTGRCQVESSVTPDSEMMF